MSNFTTSLENVQHAQLNDLVFYWKQIKKGQLMPLRQNFNPVDVPKCLRHIVLVDVQDGDPKYYIRLAGSSINPMYMKPITGKYIEELSSGKDRADILAQYNHTVEHLIPTYMTGVKNTHVGNSVSYERIILPITSDGREADKLLVGLHFFNVKQQLLDRAIFKI
ncbi:MAG: hypothetical protein COB93_05505 [Sneathiella sp.]|nr:MAG: hypothetical protein COB93_05505 [Sneathiella sp.]